MVMSLGQTHHRVLEQSSQPKSAHAEAASRLLIRPAATVCPDTATVMMEAIRERRMMWVIV